MTRDQVREAIQIMQAYIDGVGIQWRADGKWEDVSPCDPLAWDFQEYQYRIKPSPAELWVNFHDEYAIPLAYRSKEEAEQEARNGCRRVAVYMTEPGS